MIPVLDSQCGARSELVLAAHRDRGRFYPDFVARLDDGRLLVVEYKGALLTDEPETREKRTIGALWERESGGEGLFLMAEKMVDGKDVRSQLMEKIGL